jgi:hypothetical protein
MDAAGGQPDRERSGLTCRAFAATRDGHAEIEEADGMGSGIAALVLVALTAAQQKPPAAKDAQEPVWQFVDVAAESGIDFKHSFGDDQFSKILEDTGSGVALIDYDNDELLDVFLSSGQFVEGLSDPAFKSKTSGLRGRLYRNLGGLKFEDVTDQVGIKDAGFGMGAVVGDYDGDGDDDLLWQNGNTMVAWEMEAGGYVTNHNLPGTSSGYSVRASGDFNGDGTDDILWRSTAGATVTWIIEDLAFDTNTNLGTVSTTYDVAGAFDLDADGDDDILWRHTNGDVVAWIMQGGTLAYTRSYGNVSPSSYTLAGAGDFDHDGDADLLWDAVSGSASNVIWRMQGGLLHSTATLPAVGTSYAVLGIDDFNDDGTDDILWRDAGGSMVAWQMSNMAIASTPSYGAPAPGWTPLRVGEFEL